MQPSAPSSATWHWSQQPPPTPTGTSTRQPSVACGQCCGQPVPGARACVCNALLLLAQLCLPPTVRVLQGLCGVSAAVLALGGPAGRRADAGLTNTPNPLLTWTLLLLSLLHGSRSTWTPRREPMRLMGCQCRRPHSNPVVAACCTQVAAISQHSGPAVPAASAAPLRCTWHVPLRAGVRSLLLTAAHAACHVQCTVL